MKIAFLGIRGIPSSYSGFETFVENFGKALVKPGHQVTVYNRSSHLKYKKNFFCGIRIITLPSLKNKFLDTFLHTFLSLVHVSFSDNEIIYICGVGNSSLAFIPRLFKKKVILNVDGLDWQREKWGFLAKIFLKFSEYMSTLCPSLTLTDSKTIQKYYQQKYNKKIEYIPYFVNIENTESTKTLEKYNLEKDKYILFVGRLVPENKAEKIIQAYQQLDTELKLVIVGDAPYSQDYIRQLKKHESDNIIFTGYLFGLPYQELSSSALIFALPSHAGGTRVVLLEQLALGNCLVVNDSANNQEVTADSAYLYQEEDENSLSQALKDLLNHPEKIESYRKQAQERYQEKYSFEQIMQDYDHLFSQLRTK